MYILYKLTFKSGKSYIGQTVRKMQTRFYQHRADANRGSQLPVHCAWRAHGEPDLNVIGTYGSHAELHEAEIDAIASHNTLAPNGYNLGYGGETAPSKNPDVAKKIAEKATGRKIADTSTMSSAVKARWKNEESREKMLDGMKACWTDDMRKAAGERLKARWGDRKSEGWEMPESTRKKLAGRVFSDETKAKMSASAKARKREPRSKETCKKISLHVAQSWKDPEAKSKRSEAISKALKEKYANMTEEEKKAFSDTRKRAWERRKLKQTQSD